MRLAIKNFRGIAPRADARRLPRDLAQVASNCDLRNGMLRALRGMAPVWTLTKPGGPHRTIYRFGQTVTDDTLYWFHWPDDVDVVKGQVATDVDERTYFTGDSAFGHPRVTKGSIAVAGGGGTNYPLASFRLGVPAPSTAPTLGGISGVGTGTAESRQYIITYVTGDGEEGQPSTPLGVSPVSEGQAVTLNNLPIPPAGHNITSKRIYRTVVLGSRAVDYRFVEQVTAPTTSYVDSKLASALAESCPSLEWEMPPANLRGLVNLPNGMMAGFSGLDVMFCESYRPFAWPSKYRQPVDYPIVGLGTFGDTLFIGTRGVPYIAFGSEPSSVVVRKLEHGEACVAKRSIVSLPIGVLYATPNGLCLVNASGASLVTEQIIDKEFWTSLNPSSIDAYAYDGRYVAFYNNGTPHAFQYDPGDVNQPFSLIPGLAASAGFNDLVRDALYLNVGGNVRRWDSGGTPFTYTWRSGVLEASVPMNFAWAQVEADTYPVQFSVFSSDDNPASGTYQQRLLRSTLSVTNRNPFRLPSGFLSSDWEVELSGQNKVTAVYLATGIADLKAD